MGGIYLALRCVDGADRVAALGPSQLDGGGWVRGWMVAAAVLVLLVPRVWAQLLAVVIGGLVGLFALTPPEMEASAPQRLVVQLRHWVAVGLLGVAVLLLVALPWQSAEARPLLVQQLSGFLRTGALVFGGGHVVLPMLEQALVPSGWD